MGECRSGLGSRGRKPSIAARRRCRRNGESTPGVRDALRDCSRGAAIRGDDVLYPRDPAADGIATVTGIWSQTRSKQAVKPTAKQLRTRLLRSSRVYNCL